MIRALRIRPAQRLARAAPLPDKLAGAGASLAGYCVIAPLASLLLDPDSDSFLALVAVTILSTALLFWGYFIATCQIAGLRRRRVRSTSPRGTDMAASRVPATGTRTTGRRAGGDGPRQDPRTP